MIGYVCVDNLEIPIKEYTRFKRVHLDYELNRWWKTCTPPNLFDWSISIQSLISRTHKHARVTVVDSANVYIYLLVWKSNSFGLFEHTRASVVRVYDIKTVFVFISPSVD